jgi:hypothetical protein
MELHLSAEHQAELADYAQRHGQDPATALSELVADALTWERQYYRESVEGIRKGYESMKASGTRPASEFMNELRAKHGF